MRAVGATGGHNVETGAFGEPQLGFALFECPCKFFSCPYTFPFPLRSLPLCFVRVTAIDLDSTRGCLA